MAEKVVTADLERAGLGGLVEVDSSGTGHWHVGGEMDPRAASTLRVHGYLTSHTARQFDPSDLATRDLVLAMDLDNLDELRRSVDQHGGRYGFDPSRLRLYRSFAPGGGPNPEVPDPYYGGDEGFEEVLTLVETAAEGVAEHIADELSR